MLFSNRSAALLKMGRFSQALRDATTAREIDPSWPKVRKLIITQFLFFALKHLVQIIYLMILISPAEYF